MSRKVLAGLVVFSLLMAGLCFAESYEKTIVIRAHITPVEGMDVTISKITPGDNGDVWEDASEIDFGDLQLNEENMIMLPQCYYAVDVGVLSNSEDWSIKHEAGPIAGPDTLDDNVNVTFVKQTATGSSLVGPGKVTYGESNGVVISKEDLEGGWLRIYYGIATGNTDPANGETDAPNAKPITLEKPSGYYVGTITLTLTTS